MTIKFEKIYSSMSSAKRGAVRAGLQSPVFVKRENGKVIVTVGNQVKVVSQISSTVASPVAKFREIFSQNYNKARRKEVIELAVKQGIARGTATTYYQKLASAASK